MTHAVPTALSGVWPFAVTNVDDFVVLTALFVTVGRGGPTNRQIVVGQYLGIGALVVVSLVASIGLASVPDRWIGLLGVIPIALGVRGLVGARTVPSDGRAAAAVTGVIGVVALTLANGADNVSVYVPLFRQAGTGTTSVYVLVFAVLVGVWCMAARAVAGQRPLIRMVERIGHWLVPLAYIAIGIRIIVTSGLFGT
jgi:cadmium resistance protein CadD (predicted permease)